jgi:hypothetical protein
VLAALVAERVARRTCEDKRVTSSAKCAQHGETLTVSVGRAERVKQQ